MEDTPPEQTVGRIPRAAWIGLVALTLLLALPGIVSQPITDRDEARYVQASRQMVESGDWLRVRFLDQARNRKPAGIYWLQAASVHLSGVRDAAWPYRLVSVGAALLAVLLTARLAARLGMAQAWVPAAMLAATPLLAIIARTATTDAALLLTVVCAQSCLAELYGRRGGWGAALCLWLALAAGVLIKGPVTPLIAGLTVLALCGLDRDRTWLRRLRPAVGAVLLAGLVLPWLVAIQRATDGAFLRESLVQDFFGKAQQGRESHGAPPGYYLVGLCVLCWPLFPLALRGAAAAWRARPFDRAARFLLAWLVPSWLLFEAVPTKLPHYVLPLYPALALLAVGGWPRAAAPTAVAGAAVASAGPRWRRLGAVWGARLVAGGWWLGAAALALTPPLAASLLAPDRLGAAWVATVATLLVAAAWRRPCEQPARAARLAALFAAVWVPIVAGVVAPGADALWLTRRLAARAVELGYGGRPVVAYGYTEPSLAFAFGTSTCLVKDPAAAVAALQSGRAALALVQDAPPPLDQDPWLGAWWARRLPPDLDRRRPGVCEAFLAAAAQAGLPVHRVGTVDGWNYSRGKRVRVLLYGTRPAPPDKEGPK